MGTDPFHIQETLFFCQNDLQCLVQLAKSNSCNGWYLPCYLFLHLGKNTWPRQKCKPWDWTDVVQTEAGFPRNRRSVGDTSPSWAKPTTNHQVTTRSYCSWEKKHVSGTWLVWGSHTVYWKKLSAGKLEDVGRVFCLKVYGDQSPSHL